MERVELTPEHSKEVKELGVFLYIVAILFPLPAAMSLVYMEKIIYYSTKIQPMQYYPFVNNVDFFYSS